MWLILGFIVFLVFWLLPIKIGAILVRAGRTGLGACFLALLVSWFFVFLFSLVLWHGGVLLSVFTTALAYMMVLRTTYLKGLAIAVIQFMITWIFVFIAGAAMVGPTVYGVFRV
ncbi:MAG TPA: hypothetical protein VH328_06630 [Burkholderiaceae bacterium]|jgi:hypothetical protein|nr:hypothetical protein [Burkholderiaceae bacterium]